MRMVRIIPKEWPLRLYNAEFICPSCGKPVAMVSPRGKPSGNERTFTGKCDCGKEWMITLKVTEICEFE